MLVAYNARSNFNGGLTKPPMTLEHGCVITSHTVACIYVSRRPNPGAVLSNID